MTSAMAMSELSGTDAPTARGAAGAEEFLRLIAERDRARRGAGAARSERAGRSPWRAIMAAVVWGCLAGCALAGALFVLSALGLAGTRLALGVGAAGGLAFLIAGAAMRFNARGGDGSKDSGRRRNRPAPRLAGPDMLTALGVAEKVLDADPDARLVTRRDGVVIYANPAYEALAIEAGVVAPSGLPPRADRLFAQQGAEATKIFRLCRAAKSAVAADEIIRQRIGLADGGRNRRFEVSVRPVPGSEDHVAWRMRELAADEEEHDGLAASFADFPRPVFAIEKSGAIAWANAATRASLGVERGALGRIDDIVLGESSELVRNLWRIDQAPLAAKIRQRAGETADALLTAFRRGGVGEGFVCVELAVREERAESNGAPVSGDLTEAPFGVAVVEGQIGGEARIVEANKAFADAFGAAKKNAPLARIFEPEALAELAEEIRRKGASGGLARPVEAIVREGPRAGAYALYARPARRRRGAYGAQQTLIYSVDVSDRKQMEHENRRDQKLKSIGKLTGEIAHDFNNLLQVVLGNCERLVLRHPAGDPDYAELLLIRGNALRASSMIKQLLAFSRTQTLKREVLSITELLREWGQFLNRAVGEKVEIQLVNGRGLPPVRVDKNQLESALMNLAVNARDAMGAAGGRLTIATSLVPAAEISACGAPNLPLTDHLLIEIADTGPGVPADLRDKIFEPYFTTKDVGKGTGLGLATVYGIVTQMEGAIAVGDAPGGGAAFRIWLPAHDGEAIPALEPEAPAREGPIDLTGAGRILVVEDEDAVRTFVVTALEDCGYEVTTAADAEEALELIGEDADGFDLVLSDVMMPDTDGPTMISRARAEHQLSARVLFMSAYAESTVREQIDALDAVGYIQKPFTLKGLASKVKQTMHGERGDAAA